MIPYTDWLRAVGGAIQRAVAMVGWSHKEAAARIGVDDAEFGKWNNWTRRPQMDRLFAVPELRQPLVVAFAELCGAGVEVTTVVSIKRSVA
jgi:hypothetical protein